MDKNLLQRIKGDTPPLNPDVANGLAVKFMPFAQGYIDSVFRAIAKDFPKGLEYKGCQRCTPFEEFYNEPKKRNDRKLVDIARSDIYLMRYNFRFNGVDLPPRYIFLPFVGEAGSIVLGGPTYFISPVLSDIILSYEPDNVFVKLLRDRFMIKRVNHNLIIDGKMETMSVAWSMIHHYRSKSKVAQKPIKAECTLMHYLLCRYGFTETFKRFANCTPFLGKDDINTDEYPPSDWVIYKSAQFKPKTIVAKQNYIPSELRVAIRRSEFTPLVKSMIAAFFYITDHFPLRVLPEKEYVDNVRLWKTLLGHLIFGSDVSEGKLHDDIEDHMRSLDEYVDALMIAKFKEINMDIKDIYQFFIIAIENFNDWLLSAQTKANTLYNKELSTLFDLLMPITSSIFNFHFKLKSAEKKGLTERDVIETMNKNLKPRVIFKLVTQINGVSNMSYSGDNKCMKITTTMVPQKSTGGKSDNEAQSMKDPTKRLHVSFAEVGGYIMLSGSNLIGTNRVNAHVNLDENAKILRDPAKVKLLDSIQEQIQRE